MTLMTRPGDTLRLAIAMGGIYADTDMTENDNVPGQAWPVTQREILCTSMWLIEIL